MSVGGQERESIYLGILKMWKIGLFLCCVLLFLAGCMWPLENPMAFSSVLIYSSKYELKKDQRLNAVIHVGNPVRQVNDCLIKQEKDGHVVTETMLGGTCIDGCIVQWLVDSNVVDQISLQELTNGNDYKVIDLLVKLEEKRFFLGPPKGNHWEINLDSLKKLN